MELEFRETKRFQKDLRDFSEIEERRISEYINRYSQTYLEDKPRFYRRGIHVKQIELADGLKATLFCLPIGKDIRVLLTLDEDPIFDLIAVTLLRVVRHNELEKAFDSLVESLYQNYLNRQKEQ